MTLPQARSLYPGLTARARDPESERAAQEALLEIADTFSPRVEDAGEGVVYGLAGLPPSRGPGMGRGLPPPPPFAPGGGRPQGPALRHHQDHALSS
jgi:hypothetical protein